MAITVCKETFDSIENEWVNILSRCPANTIFITPWWQRLWWEHFGADAELHILSVRDDGELIGIAPMMVSNGVLSFLGDTDLFDYHDFLVPEGKEDAFYNAICEHFAAMDSWSALTLKSLRESSPTLERLPLLARSKGYTAEIEQEDVSPKLDLPASWDEYVSSLSKKERHELRRKLRRLEAADHATQYACDDPDTLACNMGDFFKLLRASSPEKDEFMIPAREKFFVELAQDLARRGIFKLYFLEVEQKRVASCICFDYGDTYLLYNSGYDPEYSRLSVGLLNKALTLKQAIDEGKRSYDFLRGTERYKYDLGATNQIVHQMTIRR
jgi:CelD/BcsL family acetyltransferase involved in cellulose biosynthesis